MGGVRTVFGAIVGAVVIASLDNRMSLFNAPSFRQTIVKRLVLLLAVWFDMSRNKGERAWGSPGRIGPAGARMDGHSLWINAAVADLALWVEASFLGSPHVVSRRKGT